MAGEAEIETVRRILSEALDGGDFTVLDELASPDYVDHEAPPDTPRGAAGMRRVFEILRTGFPDGIHIIQDIFASEDKVVARVEWRGTHLGDFPSFGIGPTGKHMVEKQVHIFRMKNGKVIEHWACRDDLGMMRQLGVIAAHP
jgi:predicted ester cyclase